MIALLIGLALADDGATRILLLGDGGSAAPGTSGGFGSWWTCPKAEVIPESPVVTAARAMSRDGDYAIWLGDNVYECGAANERDERAQTVLARQVAVLADPAAVMFVPGNHDWNQSINGRGWERIRAQAGLLAGMGAVPLGFSDPVVGAVDLPHVRILWVDSERAIEGGPTERVALAAKLRALDDGAGGRTVLVVEHHPWESVGPHGTTAHPLGDSDFGTKDYDAWRAVQSRFAEEARNPVVFAAGHDHDLQILRKDGVAQIVSGSGSRASSEAGLACKDGVECLQTSRRNGFVVLEVTAEAAEARLVTIEPTDLGGCAPSGDSWACTGAAIPLR